MRLMPSVPAFTAALFDPNAPHGSSKPEGKPVLVLVDHATIDEEAMKKAVFRTTDAFKHAGTDDPTLIEIMAVVPWASLVSSDEEMNTLVDALLGDPQGAIDVAARVGNGDAVAADVQRLFDLRVTNCVGDCGDSLGPRNPISTPRLIRLLDNVMLANNEAAKDKGHRYNATLTSMTQGDAIVPEPKMGDGDGEILAKAEQDRLAKEAAAKAAAASAPMATSAKVAIGVAVAGGAVALTALIVALARPKKV